jgi:hypothetical protein
MCRGKPLKEKINKNGGGWVGWGEEANSSSKAGSESRGSERRRRNRFSGARKSGIKSDTELVEPRKVLPILSLRPVHLK